MNARVYTCTLTCTRTPARTHERPRARTPTHPPTYTPTHPQPEYWAEQMRGKVRFQENAATLLKWAPAAVVEVGPGSTLCSLMGKCQKAASSLSPGTDPASLVRSMPAARAKVCVCVGVGTRGGHVYGPMCKGSATRTRAHAHTRTRAHTHTKDAEADLDVFDGILASLWRLGVSVDWQALHALRGHSCLRSPLPGYVCKGHPPQTPLGMAANGGLRGYLSQKELCEACL